MQIDLVVLAVVGLFGLLGLICGAVKQISHWAGLIIGIVASKPLAAALAPAAAAKLGCAPMLAQVGLSCLLFVVLTALGAAVFHFIVHRIIGEHENGPVNRIIGAVLGGGKAAAALYVALSGLVFFEAPLAKALPAAEAQTKASRAVAFTREHSLFEAMHSQAMEELRKLAEARKDPEALKKLLNDPKLKSLMNDQRLKAVLSDPALKQALAGGSPAALLDNPKVKELLNDPAVQEQLAKLKGR